MTHRLLFIDDIAEDSEIAAWQLRQASIEVEYTVVANEPSLLDSIAQHAPQLILSDISLPEWDCWAARRLCAERLPGVPFALYSGVVSTEDKKLCIMRGVFGAAEKDSPRQLVSLVRRALGLS